MPRNRSPETIAKDAARKKRIRKQWIADGLCERCGTRRDTDVLTCEICLVKVATRRAGIRVAYWRDVQDLFTGKCAITGVDIEIGKNAHLDHIMPKSRHPDLANAIENVQWVHSDINMMKRDFDPGYFLELCKKVVDFAEKRGSL